MMPLRGRWNILEARSALWVIPPRHHVPEGVMGYIVPCGLYRPGSTCQQEAKKGLQKY